MKYWEAEAAQVQPIGNNIVYLWKYDVVVKMTKNGFVQNGFPDSRIATSPNAVHEVPLLMEDIVAHEKSLAANDPKARLKLLDAARALVYALETPRETMIRYCWSQVSFLSDVLS
jgi:hypothetical protein